MPTTQTLIAELLNKLHEFGVPELSHDVWIEVGNSADPEAMLDATIVDHYTFEVYKFKLAGAWERVE